MTDKPRHTCSICGGVYYQGDYAYHKSTPQHKRELKAAKRIRR